MARFVIEYAAGIEKRRQTSFLARRSGLVRELDVLTVGTRSTSGLVLDDPLVADQHCSLTWRGDDLLLEDLGTTLGTYLDGMPVTAPTPLGAQGEIVLGVSRISYRRDAETRVTNLTVDDQGFHYKAFKPDLDKQDPGDEYDSVRWTKSETRFGRLPGLLPGNLLAALLVLLLVPAALVRALREPWFEPGPLAQKHLAVMGPGGSRKDGCATCHDGFAGGTPARKCAQSGCHELLLRDFHPNDAPFRDGRASCTICHWDHQGRGDAARADAVPGFIPDQARTPRTCSRCHQTGVPQEVRRATPPQTYGLVNSRNSFATFSHQQHVAQHKIPCADCHTLRTQDVAADLASGFPARAFATVAFATCMGCHKPDSTHPRAPTAQHRFAVTWHGRDDPARCRQCHQTRARTAPDDLDIAAALRTSAVATGVPTFAFATRSHTEQQTAHTGEPRCESCHLDQVFGGGGQRKDVVFPHQGHLARLIPRDATDRKALNAQCAACHLEQAAARALATPHYPGPADPGGKIDPCAECHKGSAAVRPRLLPPAAEPARQRVDFPHAVHVQSQDPTLANGCYTCHEFRSDANALTARPRTLEAAADCSLCHRRHEHVGGGHCARCHQDGDRVWFGPGQGGLRSWPVDFDSAGVAVAALSTTPPGPLLPGARSEVPRLTPRPTRFSHRSQGHADVACDVCHATAGQATTVAQVPIPGEADAVCRDCHVRRQTRFHWR